MWVWLLSRLKLLVLAIVGTLRRAICCCFRRKQRRDSNSSIPVHATTSNADVNSWDDQWGELSSVVGDGNTRELTVQQHIENYRHAKQNTSKEDEVLENYFEDMTPEITRQPKVLLASESSTSEPTASRFSIDPSVAYSNFSTELEAWEEGGDGGWEADSAWAVEQARQELRMQRMQQKKSEREREKVRLGTRLANR